MSAAGTAQFVYGTGTNCGTGQVDLTADTNLALGIPWTVFLPTGIAFRTNPGQALCVTAVTGNVTGFLSYAQ